MASPLQPQEDLLAAPIEGEEEQYSPEEIAGDITTIVKQIDRTERITRDRMLRLWKYLELLWCGAGNYYWDHAVGQWRAITQEDIALLANEAEIDPTLINKVINVSRPYGESMIGVLTTGMPRVKYFPKDADNDLDVLASKAYSNIEQKIVDDNMVPIRLMEMLVKLWNGGFCAVYNYSHSDRKYGVVREAVYENKDFNQKSLICSNCGDEITGEKEPKVDEVTEEMAPDTTKSPDEMLDEEEIPVQPEIPPEMSPEMMGMPEMPETEMAFCEECGMETPHLSSNVEGNEPFQTGEVELPKSRQIINVYGPMNVKIPAMATKKEHVFWLIMEEEIDVALAKHLYQDHKDKITVATSYDIDIDRLARSSYEVSEDTLRECATIRQIWLSPAAYEKLDDQDKVKFYKEKYPKGVKAIFCADTYLEAEEQDLNDHWTISINPLYPRVMADPLGKALIGLHETSNDLFQLEVDTVRYSIPQTFLDPASFDFEAYRNTRALPGSITPLKRPSGGSLNDVFAETRTATLPKEVENLDAKVERLLQFISGVLPSVFGGPATGSKTFGEYEQSRNQALQRLSIIWKVISVTYAEVMAKATKAYKDDLKEDEHFVQEQGKGNYVNVWIRREQLKGEIGEVRPELSEQFPMTWGQKSARVMELLSMNNQAFISWLMHPENVELIYQVLGVDDLYIPGEDQRNKQLYEISEMLVAQPMPTEQIDPNTGQPVMMSSVQPEEIDDDTIHSEVIKTFLNSAVGIDLKMSNSMAYQNIMLHYQAHQQRIMMAQMQAQQAQIQAAPAPEQGTEQVQ